MNPMSPTFGPCDACDLHEDLCGDPSIVCPRADPRDHLDLDALEAVETMRSLHPIMQHMTDPFVIPWTMRAPAKLRCDAVRGTR